jgi:hypothetical protein
MADLMESQEKFSEAYNDGLGKIARARLFASEETFQALDAFTCALVASFVQLALTRARITISYAPLDLAGSEDSEVRRALRIRAPQDQLILIRECCEAGLSLETLIPPVIISIRKELELPLDAKRYVELSTRSITRLRELVSDFTAKLQSLIDE